MITAKTRQAYRKALRRGVPEGELKEQMRAAGFSEEDIASVFWNAPKNMQGWFIAAGAVFLLLGLYFIGLRPRFFWLFCFVVAGFCAYKVLVPTREHP